MQFVASDSQKTLPCSVVTLRIALASLCVVIAGEARGQQEGLQYGRGSSGVVDNRVAQVENIRKIWDRSDEGAISGLAIIFCA